MSPVDRLSKDLKALFPAAEIETRESDDRNGFHFLNLFVSDFAVSVEWKKNLGFGISFFSEASSPSAGLFAAPTEWCETEPAALRRISSLVQAQLDKLRNPK